MGVVKFFVDRPVLVHLTFAILLIWGLFSLAKAPLDVYPDLPFYEVVVTTSWPGAGADEIERLVTEPLEERFEQISDISRMVSWSRAGVSIIDIKFEESISDDEMRQRLADVRAAIDEVDDLPADADNPIVQNLTIDEVWPVIYVGVLDEEVPEGREHLLRSVAERLERRLEALPGVRSVDLPYERQRWLIGEISRQALDRCDLTLSEVIDAAASEAEDAPAGDLRREGEATMESTAVSAAGAVEGPESLGERIIRRLPDGGHIRLSDIAEIIDGFADARTIVRLNGRPTSTLTVVKEHSANAVDVVDEVRREVDRFTREELPPGLSLALSNDTTQIIHSRLRVLLTNLGYGSILVFLILMFVLGVRQSLLAIVGLPFSFISAFIVLGWLGVSLNAMTIFSMVLVAGMAVDDAIIVLENIHRHWERGRRGPSAIVEAVREVFWPVNAAIATTVAAFLPLLLMSGVMGEFFKIIPLTVIAVLIASLIECLFILPGHYLEFGVSRRHLEQSSIVTRADRFRNRIDMATRGAANALARRVEWLIGRRWTVLSVSFILMLGCFGLATHLKTVLFPSDYQVFLITVNTPPGSNLDQTSELLSEIEGVLEPHLDDELISFITTVGQGWTPDNTMEIDPVVGQMIVELSDRGAEDPAATMEAMRVEVMAHLDAHPEFPCDYVIFQTPNDGPPLGKAVAVQVLCGDYDEGRLVAERIRAELATMTGVKDISVNLRTGLRRADLVLDENMAAAHDLTFAQVARELQLANFGMEIGRWFDDEQGERVEVWLRLAQDDRDTLADLAQAPVRTPAGARLELQDVARFQVTEELATRYHRAGDRCVQVTAEVDNENLTSLDANKYLRARADEFTAGFPGVTLEFGGQFEETEESFASLIGTFLIALLLIFTILAVQFNSVIQPLIVATAIPFAGAGVVLGMWIFGFEFTYPTGVALVGLAGVVVNDSLILVEFINRRRDSETTLVQAVCDGVRIRFRPILLTTLTTIGGLLPMAIGVGGYSLIWSPFAAALIFGMISSTCLNLLLVPCFYVIAEDVRALRRHLTSRREAPHEWPGAVRD
ncbi:efflux RND transporter permease subunit [Candidatus Sumerlaeota bacterium]|nr:efflux RND transporter permease subunit [Candidatus Sumerlaeota bacterium]